MIPKAQLLALAKHYELQPTTVQKDYVIGWLLRAISEHDVLSKWLFKSGTCLKKCYFETYRFSEDLDFTIPLDLSVGVDSIKININEAVSWIESKSGLGFPREDWKIEEYKNPRGKTSFQMKISFSGPLGLPSKSLQRVKFDLTQDELIAGTTQLRNLNHDYTDVSNPAPQILCYSINEVLAEKTRALVERNGRARDVYDVVNISRNFRVTIDPQRTKDIANKKFRFKGLKTPSVEYIMDSIDNSVLRANWEHQLAHQISSLCLRQVGKLFRVYCFQKLIGRLAQQQWIKFGTLPETSSVYLSRTTVRHVWWSHTHCVTRQPATKYYMSGN